MDLAPWLRCWRSGLPLVLAAALAGVDAGDAQPSGVADPLGLGERLALIDFLQSHGGTVEPGTSLEDLRRAYRLANPDAATLDAQAERDDAVLQLWRRFGEAAPADASLDQIQARLAELGRQAAARDQAELALERAESARAAASVAASPPTGAGAARAGSVAGAGPGATGQPTAAAPAQAARASLRLVPPPADLGPTVRLELISEDASPILVVVCDTNLAGTIEPQLQSWPAAARLAAGVDGTVVFLGHSDGRSFSRGVVKEHGEFGSNDLSVHLQHNRAFYESMAGTRAAKPIDCAAMCGCNEQGANQEQQLRDGFGYRPLHRVFTVPGCLDSPNLVAHALVAICSAANDPATPYQARFERSDIVHEHGHDLHVACFGLVEDGALQPLAPIRRFLLKDQALVEMPAP